MQTFAQSLSGSREYFLVFVNDLLDFFGFVMVGGRTPREVPILTILSSTIVA